MPGARLWAKMLAAGGVCCIGGPWLIYYVSPSEEELFMRYNPELQRRSLETRQERQEDFDKFVNRLKEYSKSDQPIWTAWEKDGEKKRQQTIAQQIADRKAADEAAEQRRLEIKKQSQ